MVTSERRRCPAPKTGCSLEPVGKVDVGAPTAGDSIHRQERGTQPWPPWVIALFLLLFFGPSPVMAGSKIVLPANLSTPSSPILLVAMFGFLALSFGRRSRSLLDRSSESEVRVTAEDVRRDCSALAISMAQLAQGDLSVRLAVSAQPIRPGEEWGKTRLAEVLNPVIASLREAADEFNELTEVPCKRLCYVGADSFVEGRACGEAMGRALQGQGEVAIVTSLFSRSGPELRRKGFASVIHEQFPGIWLIPAVEGSEDNTQVSERTRELLREHRNLRGIYVTVGATPHAVARAVVEAGKAGEIAVITHDLVEETMTDIRAGVITATLGQDPFAQGYEPVIHLFNHLVTGWRPQVPRLLTHRDLVTRENCGDFWDDVKGIIESSAVAERRTWPTEVQPPRPLRLAVIGREDAKFWEPVRDGVLAAGEKLKSRGTSVEWVVPQPDLDGGFISARAHGGLIDSLIAQKYDGIATAAFDKDYIAYINRAVASGVAVVTYNTEPISLRALIAVILEQADRLLDYSHHLSETIQAVNQATGQINLAMSQVSQGTSSQNEHVAGTHTILSSLLEQLEEITREAGEGAAAAEEAAKAAQAGDDAVSTTRTSMQGIAGAVTETAKTVEALGEQSEKIDSITRLISSIAYQIKLLGINAAIEAAHAGQYGAGFLVVAGEIRSLAERTADASREISGLIESVKASIHGVEKVMDSVLGRVSQGAALAEHSTQVLTTIRNAVNANQARLAAISSAMLQTHEFSHQVGNAMESVAAISEENAAAVEEVTASTEEMSGQLEEVARLARSLAVMADSTREMLGKFNLG
jgi:methyl-accepting chemotaxis protein